MASDGWRGWQRLSLGVLMALALWFLWLMYSKTQTRQSVESLHGIAPSAGFESVTKALR